MPGSLTAGKVDVVTGIENSAYIEIKSGLSVGDTVCYTEQTPSFFWKMIAPERHMSAAEREKSDKIYKKKWGFC